MWNEVSKFKARLLDTWNVYWDHFIRDTAELY